MKRSVLATLLVAIVASAFGASPPPSDFRWHAGIVVPSGSGLVRARLPADAFGASLSSGLADVRVFNGDGHAVPFAFMPVPEHEEPARSEMIRALSLYSATVDRAVPRSSIRVHIDDGTAERSVWVQGGEPAPAAGVRRLDAALFDLRAQASQWSGIEITAKLPANTPVRVSAWTSADLSQWDPLPLRGRLFRFDGESAPANNVLTFDVPRMLQGRYLRLDWQGQAGIEISALRGMLSSTPQRARTEWSLGPLRPADGGALEVDTNFASPLAGLRLQPQRDNTLAPVRILVRKENSEPWREVGQTVVYRLGAGADLATNAALDLPHPVAMHIRIEAARKGEAVAAPLDATALFDPVQVIFVPSGPPPFTLTAGLADMKSTALPLQTLAQAQAGKPLDAVLEVQVGPGEMGTAPANNLLDRWWPAHPGTRSAALWGTLAIAVLVLGAVAFSLAREIRRDAKKDAASET